MKTLVIFIFLALISLQVSAVEQRNFGTGAEMDKLISISTVLKSPKSYLNQDITVKGTIVSVCEKRGCWMKLASDKKFQTLRIKVRDGDMVFPLNSQGKTAYATGQLKGIALSKEKAIAYLQHMADESKEHFDPTSITQGITIYQLTPKGVTIVN